MPADIKKKSNWRQNVWRRHGNTVSKAIIKMIKPKQRFGPKDLYNKIEEIDYLADATRYDVVMGVCAEMYQRKILEKQGSKYYLANVNR